MEDESRNPEEESVDYPDLSRVQRPIEPRAFMVLLVLLGLSLLFSLGGVLVFRALATSAGWDQSVLSGALAPDAAPAQRWQMRLLLVISHLTTFLLAGWATVRLFYPPARKALDYLGVRIFPGLKILLAAVLLMLVSVPLVLYLYQINKALPMPDSFRLLEDQTNDAIKGLLQMDTPLELLANLALIALLPAIGEELVFRGIVQQQLLRRVARPWVALVLTAAIFSFIHFQFEGFLPRMLLGLLLGWLYWRTGNLWVSVAAHFANNGAQVLGQYLYSRNLSTVDMEQDIEVPWFAAAVSMVLIWWIVRWINTMLSPDNT